jgi:hypothetical protein
VRDYALPHVPMLRIVNQSGTWYTLDGETESVVQTWPAVNWDWDGDTSKPTRFWLIIYSAPTPNPWDEGTSYDDGNVWDGEIVAQMEMQRVQYRLKASRSDHADRQAMHLLADRIVRLAVLKQLAHPAFELPILVAQGEHLSFGDRYGSPAVRMGNDHLGQDFGVFLEELRVIL